MEVSNVFFSIVVPVYNVEQFLQKCLDSVVNQMFPNYEVICVDDGSTDKSAEILNEYALRYPFIRIIRQPNKGLSGARNTGIQAASGDYIVLLDSDDWLQPNALRVFADNLSDEDMLCYNGELFYEDGKNAEMDTGFSEFLMNGWDYYNKYALVQRRFHFVCTVLRVYRREFLLQNHLQFKEGIYHEDNLFTPVACYFARKVKVIPDNLYHYRIREGSISQTPNIKRLFDIITVANELAAFFVPLQGMDKRTVYREIAGEYFKGFMPDEIQKYGNLDKELTERINWNFFKKVSIFSRHKRIFILLKINPIMFRWYMVIETFYKKWSNNKHLYILTQ